MFLSLPVMALRESRNPRSPAPYNTFYHSTDIPAFQGIPSLCSFGTCGRERTEERIRIFPRIRFNVMPQRVKHLTYLVKRAFQSLNDVVDAVNNGVYDANRPHSSLCSLHHIRANFRHLVALCHLLEVGH